MVKGAELGKLTGVVAAAAFRRRPRGAMSASGCRGLGRRRLFEPRPRCSPQLGAMALTGCRLEEANVRATAIENEGQGMGRGGGMGAYPTSASPDAFASVNRDQEVASLKDQIRELQAQVTALQSRIKDSEKT